MYSIFARNGVLLLLAVVVGRLVVFVLCARIFESISISCILIKCSQNRFVSLPLISVFRIAIAFCSDAVFPFFSLYVVDLRFVMLIVCLICFGNIHIIIIACVSVCSRAERTERLKANAQFTSLSCMAWYSIDYRAHTKPILRLCSSIRRLVCMQMGLCTLTSRTSIGYN